jgi:hypothetical protein
VSNKIIKEEGYEKENKPYFNHGGNNDNGITY